MGSLAKEQVANSGAIERGDAVLSTESTKKRFQDPILCIDAKQVVHPIPEPVRVHTDSSNPGEDRPSLPWLLTHAEENERDQLLDKIQAGIQLSEQEKTRLQHLLTKRGLGDGDSAAKLILQNSDRIPFTPER